MTAELRLAFEAFTNGSQLTVKQANEIVKWYGPYVPRATEPAIVIAARRVLA